MRVILADAEKPYLENMLKALQTRLPDLEITAYQTLSELLSDPRCREDGQLLICNRADFPDLPEYFNEKTVSGFKVISLYPTAVTSDQTTGQALPGDYFWRHQPIGQFIQIINDWQVASKSMQTPEHAGGTIHFLFCAEPPGYNPGKSKSRLDRMLKNFSHVIYLPLMPTCQMQLVCPPGQGNNLSDLLLHLLGGPVPADHLGHYLQPNPNGCLQFRPPDRSDDLITCGPDVLRQLLVLIRSHIALSEGRTAALIDCAGLPFSSLAAIAVLCDCCEVIMPDGDRFAAIAARNEISRLLAELPATTRVIGVNEHPGGHHAA